MEQRSEKVIGEEIQQRQLHDDLIAQQIVPWLPIKPLLRCMVLSKRFYSTISSPNFMLKHIKQPLFSHSVSPIETLLIQSGNNFYLYSCEHDDNVVKNDRCIEEKNLVKLNYNADVYDVENDTLYLVGSSNGLVCLGEKSLGKYFILWNPITNESHKYMPEYVKPFSAASNYEPHIRWGFGYISSLDDYKVVRIVLEGNMRFLRCVVHVFSLRTNTFKKMELVPNKFSVDQPRLVNDTLCWTTWGMETVAFDLDCETFVNFPQLGMSNPDFDTLCVIGGCLSKCTHDSQNDLVLNILESSGNVVSVPLSCDLSCVDDLIGFTKTGSIFVALGRPAMLALVDPRQRSKQLLVKFESVGRIYVAGYVSSQISPHPPAELPIASGQVA